MARRPYSRSLSSRKWKIVLLALAAAAMLLLRWWRPQTEPPPPQTLVEGIYRVQRVVDGDTLVLTNRCRVRLIGADTPETVRPNHPEEPWGREATRFTGKFVAGGEVRLEFDGPRTDKYDRLLAHVWVGDRMLGEELIRAGLATAQTHYRYSSDVKERLLAAQAEARAAGRGIWSHAAPGDGSL